MIQQRNIHHSFSDCKDFLIIRKDSDPFRASLGSSPFCNEINSIQLFFFFVFGFVMVIFAFFLYKTVPSSSRSRKVSFVLPFFSPVTAILTQLFFLPDTSLGSSAEESSSATATSSFPTTHPPNRYRRR